MWTVIYITLSERVAKKITSMLIQEGFLAKIQTDSSIRQQYEILVPEAELEDIKEIFTDILHSSLS